MARVENSTTASATPGDTFEAESIVPRLIRGAIGGVGAGVVFIVVTMWFADSLPMGQPGNPLRLISTIVNGKSALADGSANVGTGWIVHIVLSAVFGMLFALIVPMFRTNGTVALAGGIYGGLLFVANFLIIAEVWLDQFQVPNKPFELAIHIVFGHVLAVAFYSSGVRRGEKFIDVG